MLRGEYAGPPVRRELYERIQRFVLFTKNGELRSLMWRLGEIVVDRDCSDGIRGDCKLLYGLAGDDLKQKLTALLAVYESRIERSQKDRDRLESSRINQALMEADALREKYFNLSSGELQEIWNKGENQLAGMERELVRVALRQKLGINNQVEGIEMCPTCFRQRSACVCERGWW